MYDQLCVSPYKVGVAKDVKTSKRTFAAMTVLQTKSFDTGSVIQQQK